MKKTSRISPADPITSLTSSGYVCWYCYISTRAYGPSLFSVLKWLSDLMYLIFFFPRYSYLLIRVLCWQKDVCVSHPAGKQCEWDRSVRQTGIIYAIKCSPDSPCSRPCCFHTERGSEWRAVASVGQQMFSSLKETGLDWETGSGCPTRMTNLMSWMKAHNLLNRLQSGAIIH